VPCSGQGDIVEELFPAYLRDGRTAGYDVPALDSNEEMLLPEDWIISQLQDESVEQAGANGDAGTEPWLKTGRTAGYDIAAVDAGEITEPEDGYDSPESSDVLAPVDMMYSSPQQVPHTRLTESEVAARVKLQHARSPRPNGMPRVYHVEVPGANQVRL
jgi:hypothetical protein